MASDANVQNLLSELDYLANTPAEKLAADNGIPQDEIDDTLGIAQLIEEQTGELKLANDLRDGVITEAQVKAAAEASKAAQPSDANAEAEPAATATPATTAKQAAAPNDEAHLLKVASDHIAELTEQYPHATNLEFFLETGPEPVKQAFIDGFERVMGEHQDEMLPACQQIMNNAAAVSTL